MERRPKIIIALTTSDKIFEIVGWFLLFSIWFVTVIHYSNLPEIIPIHYNGQGKVDRFGGKATIFSLPIIATILFIGMTILNKFPQVFNYPTKITEDNAFNQYTNATRLIRYLKLIVVLVLGIITFRTIQIANGEAENLGIWFLPIIIGLIFIPMTYFIFKSLKVKD